MLFSDYACWHLSALVLLLNFCTICQTYVLLYDTQNSKLKQFYDCIHYTFDSDGFYPPTVDGVSGLPSIKYCVRPPNITVLQHRNATQCSEYGLKYSFSQLFQLNITLLTLLKWNIPVDQVDMFAAYQSHTFKTSNDFICNCTDRSRFGKYCEYRFYFGESFEDSIQIQLNRKASNHYGVQYVHRQRTCYTQLECDSGLICIDWRQICDGIQDCMGGIDEENCEKLEFNECEKDEYRCSNGMCVPEEYFSDGEPDCMDGTDEKDDHFSWCSDKPNVYCDERLCLKYEFSCGDGQCLANGNNRLQRSFRAGYVSGDRCYNNRDINYLCEEIGNAWSTDGGFCDTDQPVSYPDISKFSNDELCQFLVKCALQRKRRDFSCPCGDWSGADDCSAQISKTCQSEWITYPTRPVFQPFVSRLYNRNRNWIRNKIPNYLLFNGTIRCHGHQITIIDTAHILSTENIISNVNNPLLAEFLFCNVMHLITNTTYDSFCWNMSKTFNNHSYQVASDDLCKHQCLSKYRVRDGHRDCFFSNEESLNINGSCESMKTFRFKCSDDEPSCLMINSLGDRVQQCSNKYDEYLDGEGSQLSDVKCNIRHEDNCLMLKTYMKTDSIKINRSSEFEKIPYNLYCNTYFESFSRDDELESLCQDWICPKDHFRCMTGQCIPIEWVCDGEWDCNDASDEQKILLSSEFDYWNSQLDNLTEKKSQCQSLYLNDDQPFSKWCNLSTEYPCLRANINDSDAFNFTINRPCISLTQIGDGYNDCVGAQDEKNILFCLENSGFLGNVVGRGFYCEVIQECIFYADLCSILHECSNNGYRKVCSLTNQLNSASSLCDKSTDVLCYNNECKEDARCDYQIDCPDGEDEYFCDYEHKTAVHYTYRRDKYVQLAQEAKFPIYPNTIQFNFETKSNFFLDHNEKQPFGNLQNNEDPFHLVFYCNRGVAVQRYSNETICFCPPSYAGNNCEWSTDRITVFMHLDFTRTSYIAEASNPQKIVIQVLTTFHYTDHVIDHHVVHVIPQMDIEEGYVKQKFYLLYPNTSEFVEQKRIHRNSSSLCSVRFEAFLISDTSSSKLIGVWQYPIHFYFLPSYRLAKILKFPVHPHLCHSNPCSSNGTCHQLMTNESTYHCHCDSGYYGTHCEFFDHLSTRCSLNSFARQLYGNNTNPLCLCSINYYGSTCHLFADSCIDHQCKNGATCYPAYDSNNYQAYICVCTRLFFGNRCTREKAYIEIHFTDYSQSINEVSVISIQYYDHSARIYDLVIQQQEVYNGLPNSLNYLRGKGYIPALGILKLYEKNWRIEQEPRFYLLYSREYTRVINLTSALLEDNFCPHTKMLLNIVFQEDPAYKLRFNFNWYHLKYHYLCQLNQTKFICFYDDTYFCLCNLAENRAQCRRFNPNSDRCHQCLNNGRCVQGNIQIASDFLCACTRCHHGHVCQYSTEFMSNTLESLIIKDLQQNQTTSIAIYLSIIIIMFLFALVNNLCNFFTFIRPQPRKFGVGNYLLFVSMVDQCSILFLLLKFIHTIFSSLGFLVNYFMFNLISCKIVSYFLSVFTRMNFWLISLVTIERLCMTLFPTSLFLRKPRVAYGFSLLIMFIVSGMHIHEALYYTTISDSSSKFKHGMVCAMNYVQPFVSIYNRVNILIHYLIPFLIQIMGITALIIQIARSRARSHANNHQTFISLFKQQWVMQKELYITPIIIILSSLPQTILSFMYACTELTSAWQRYLLLATYFLSYLPQISGFLLYVLPSIAYREAFQQTIIARRFLGKRRRN